MYFEMSVVLGSLLIAAVGVIFLNTNVIKKCKASLTEVRTSLSVASDRIDIFTARFNHLATVNNIKDNNGNPITASPRDWMRIGEEVLDDSRW